MTWPGAPLTAAIACAILCAALFLFPEGDRRNPILRKKRMTARRGLRDSRRSSFPGIGRDLLLTKADSAVPNRGDAFVMWNGGGRGRRETTTLRNKAGREFLPGASADSPALDIVFRGNEVRSVKSCPQRKIACTGFSETCAEIRFDALDGNGVLTLTEDEEIRSRVHLEHGAVPTVIVGGAGEIEDPTPDVARMLKLAAE